MDELAREQENFRVRGIEISSFETGGFGNKRGQLKFLFFDIPQFVWKMMRFPDIVHFHVSVKGSFVRKFIFFILAKLLKRKTIFHLHAGNFTDFWAQSSKCIKFAIEYFVAKACATVAVSNAVGFELVNIGADAGRLHIIGNSARFIEEAAGRNDGQTDQQGATNYVAFAGRLTEEKGVRDLLAAVSLLKYEGVRVDVRLAGTGDTKKWARYAESSGIDDQVFFWGWLDGDEKINFLRNARLFCMPSHYEAFGIATLEAMFCSLPVVGVNIGGFPDLVENQVSGFLVEKSNKGALARCIRMLIEDRFLAERMGKAGARRAIDLYSTARVIEKYTECYEDMMARA
ncbi:glycosyltransferase family 4 protein [Paraburkholderia sp. B3]|uniref:glycosyltransferase family 4 protein n=1 Tax=Paraburkholderia sp. B3 TaxID=3134791 RepID=UPI0039822B49